MLLDDLQQFNQKRRSQESTIAKALVLAGVRCPGVVNFDDRRMVEHLTAMDERIKAACVVGFMSSMPPMLKSHIDTHS